MLFTDTFSSPQNWDHTTGEGLPCWEKGLAFPSKYSRCSVTLNPKSGWGGRDIECFLRWFFELCHGKKNPFTWFIYSMSSSKKFQISCIRKKNPIQLQHSQNFKGYVKERFLNPCTSELGAHTTVSPGPKDIGPHFIESPSAIATPWGAVGKPGLWERPATALSKSPADCFLVWVKTLLIPSKLVHTFS